MDGQTPLRRIPKENVRIPKTCSGKEGITTLIGIDPGLDGAIAWLKDDLAYIDVVDMPTMAGTGARRQVNAAELAKILRANKYWETPIPGEENRWNKFTQPVSVVYLEQVSARPGQGVSSMFSFGDSYGQVKGVIGCLGLPLILVTPQAWKKRAGIIHRDKDAARTMAQQLYPGAALGRKKDIGRADALLIARFGG